MTSTAEATVAPIEATPETMARNHLENQGAEAPHGRQRPRARPVQPLKLETGDVVRFLADHYVFTVQAVTENYVVLTAGKKEPRYTIIEWSSGHRGPHTSWAHAAVTREDCEVTARALQADHEAEAAAIARPDIGTHDNPWPHRDIELSERRKLYLDLRSIHRGNEAVWGTR